MLNMLVLHWWFKHLSANFRDIPGNFHDIPANFCEFLYFFFWFVAFFMSSSELTYSEWNRKPKSSKRRFFGYHVFSCYLGRSRQVSNNWVLSDFQYLHPRLSEAAEAWPRPCPPRPRLGDKTYWDRDKARLTGIRNYIILLLESQQLSNPGKRKVYEYLDTLAVQNHSLSLLSPPRTTMPYNSGRHQKPPWLLHPHHFDNFREELHSSVSSRLMAWDEHPPVAN